MFEQVIERIKANDSIVIAGHIRPDGDCYGSQVGLRDIIRQNFPDKQVYIVGTGLPLYYKTLGTMDEVSDEVVANSLCFMLDCNDLERIEDQRVPHTAKEMIQIDHHVIYQDFNFMFVVDEDACSTCELLTRMVVEQNLKLSPTGATALYLGMLSDTARFQFAKDFVLVYDLMKKLCEMGANPNKINKLMSMQKEEKLRLQGYVLSHYVKMKPGLIYLHLTYDELKKIHTTPDKGSSIVNSIGNVIGYPIWATFLETAEGSCICEFRSDKYPVVDLAIRHGGGGHKFASGVTIRDFNEEKFQGLLQELCDLIK